MKSAELSYFELARIYMKVGANAFGGWSTTYVLLEKEFSDKRRMLSRDQLQTAVASSQALPGPAQVIVAAQTSYFLKGVAGSIIATFFYLIPSIILTIAFSFFYFHYLAQSRFAQHLIGVQSAVAGILIGNAYKIGRQNASRLVLWLVVIMAAVASYVFKLPALLIIFGAGFMGLMVAVAKRRGEHV